MTRNEYLSQLDRYLRKLPQKDYEEAMEHFTEYFEEAGPENEAQAIQDLGSPKEAAHELLSNLLDKKIEEDNDVSNPNRSKQIIGISILAIMAAPIALPLLIALLTIILSLFIVGFSLIIAAVSISFTSLAVSFGFLWETFTQLSGHFSTFSLGLGASLLSLGLGLLLLGVTILLAQWLKWCIIKISQWIVKRGQRS